jgi:hypothetical protein
MLAVLIDTDIAGVTLPEPGGSLPKETRKEQGTP